MMIKRLLSNVMMVMVLLWLYACGGGGSSGVSSGGQPSGGRGSTDLSQYESSLVSDTKVESSASLSFIDSSAIFGSILNNGTGSLEKIITLVNN